MALGPPPWATVSFVPPPPSPLTHEKRNDTSRTFDFLPRGTVLEGRGGREREEEITRRRRHRSLKLLLRMEKWARDGNLGSWTRRSETEERLLRTPPPTPLPSRHFHSRNDETTSDWIEDSRTSVRECDFSKSKKMMRINSRGFIMITYLFISIFSQRGNVLLLFPPPPREDAYRAKTKYSRIEVSPRERRCLHIDQEEDEGPQKAPIVDPYPESFARGPLPPSQRGRNPLATPISRSVWDPDRDYKGGLIPRRFTREALGLLYTASRMSR